MFAQSIPVSGKITSAKDGSPISSASITVKGTNLGTVTDDQGNFNLNVSDTNSTLLISYLGFSTQEVSVRDRTTFNIGLDSGRLWTTKTA
jgi:hypothetical protein